MRIFNYQFIVSTVFLIMSTQQAFAGIHLTIRGNATDNNVGLIGQQVRDLSSSVAFDLGRYFRLGLTHREATTHKVGFQKSEADTYEKIDNLSRVSSNSFDLTLILYYGKTWVPYIMGGAVIKNYETQTLKSDGSLESNRATTKPLPNAGVGVGLRLNKAFTLKLSYTASPGIKIEDPENFEQTKIVRDSYTSVGISYNI